MSPWEACNTVPNSARTAASRIGEFFRGEPNNLRGLRFINMDQLQAAMQANGFKIENCELLSGVVKGDVKVSQLHMKWSKGGMCVNCLEDAGLGNIPMLTIIESWGWTNMTKAERDAKVRASGEYVHEWNSDDDERCPLRIKLKIRVPRKKSPPRKKKPIRGPIPELTQDQ